MHYARIEKSERLKRVKELLQDGRCHSTLNIVQNARVCAVNSCVSELRANGCDIDCQRKGDIWYYRMNDILQDY